MHKDGFCGSLGEVVEVLYCSEAVLCSMLNGRVL